MLGVIPVLREMLRRAQVATSSALATEQESALADAPSATVIPLQILESSDPLDRERIIRANLSEISDSLGIRYTQVCRDLRDVNRLAWTSDAHELRDILSQILRTLAPNEDVVTQEWYKQEKGTNGPTQAQRARYILLQVKSSDEAKQGADEVSLIDQLISRIIRSTYTAGSTLAHTDATHHDCIRLLFHFDALMFSLLHSSSQEQ